MNMGGARGFAASPGAMTPGRVGMGGLAGRTPFVGTRQPMLGVNRGFTNTGFGRSTALASGARLNNIGRVNNFAGATTRSALRPGFGNNVGNRGLGNTFANNRFGFGGRGFGRFGNRGFINGFWGGFFPVWGFGWGYPWWGGWGYPFGDGYGLGYGLGYGYGGYGYGPSLYGYGYWPYDNPYYAVGYGGPYDYSLPINGTQVPPDAALEQGNALFDAARNAFKQGDFASALGQTDAALKQIPSDTALHEFRGLCLFALGRYDEAAATLYAVLAAGPGWDWPTVIGLYPDVDVYTTQLRALEAFCRTNPQSATGRFVLAYLYLTQGHVDAAESALKQVVALRPSDTISSKLLKQLEAIRQGQGQGPPGGAPGEPPANLTSPEGATISGSWSAKPNDETAITLSIQPDGAFVWKVTQKGQTRQFAGHSTFGSGILTLAQDDGPALVGRVSWKDPKQMTFKVVGGGPEDPGLTFSK